MTVEGIIKQYDFNLAYAKALVADVTEKQMTTVPSNGLDNHAAFTMGHLVSGCALTAEDLGAPLEMPEGWAELFLRKGPGDTTMPDTEKEKYPTKKQLLNELEHQHNKMKKLLAAATAGQLQEKLKWRFGSYMPTLFDVVVFMCINHEAMHLGQLAAWRRAIGLSSALATL